MIGAVDIGGTKIAVGVVDDSGRLLSRVESPTDADRGYQNALDRIARMLQDAARQAGTEITGIGIGCTGPVYPCTGKIGVVDFLPGWEDKNLVGDLSQEFRVPVAMENDADAVALGEALLGAAKGKASVICVTVGTGIGGGIIFEGRLYRGVDQSHPEIGHHVVDPSGPICFCGARGCWEVLARGPAMVEWLTTQAPKDYPHLKGLTAKKICELAQQGDALARQTVERETYYLGLGVANLVTLFSPEAIVLGGSVMGSAHLFLDDLRATIRRHCGLVPFHRTEVTLASLGPDAPLLGAAQVWHHRFALGGGKYVQ
ncbi:MAG TPA: ROK family protein [Candidatus Sulfotelmatobacter sp.]|nr:ROK family protein [Candidatus Sulfotelmatobacter sp.]